MERYGEFIRTDEERMLLRTVRDYIDNEVMPVRKQLDSDYAAFEKAYKGLVDLGIQKRGFSEKHGGLGIRSAIMVTAITEEIARGDSAGFGGSLFA